MRINSVDLQERRSPSGATGRVGYIAILECRGLDKWRVVELRENNVAFGFVIEKTDAAADGCPVVLKGGVGKTAARPKQILPVVEAAPPTGPPRKDPGPVS